MDQLMDFGWKVLVPITLIYLFIVAAAMLVF
jgi:NADH:ubiquinone oxidoreductase subunit H